LKIIYKNKKMIYQTIKKKMIKIVLVIIPVLIMVLLTSCSPKEQNENFKYNMNTIAFFEIQSSQPEREVEFYKAVFGWNFVKDEHLPIEYYHIETAGISGGLLQRSVAVPPDQCGTNAFTISIQVDNFDETSAKILKAGGRIAMPKFAIWGRWQGYFIDTDNNVFGIFEIDENAK